MNFKFITIKNFRNFEDISIDLTNKNVLFGMNDVGKTNFLYALRFLFDKDIRKQNFNDADYYKKNIDAPIEIILAIDISDTEDDDCKKLRARLKGAILSDQNIVYTKLRATYDKKEMVGVPMLYWGGDIEELEEMKVHGTFYEIDYVFNVIYIDAYVDLYTLFKKNANTLLVNDKEQDKEVLDNIHRTCDELNTQISGLSGIKKFEEKIAPEYKKFRHEDVSVSVKSEIAVKGLYSNIVPYIKRDKDNSLYPTSGEGRKKLLVYSIFDLLAKEEEEKKINLFLIEEPENHLHRSMQISLSHILFQNQKYQYLFLTTHSPYVLAEMDQVNLVRIYNEDKIVINDFSATIKEGQKVAIVGPTGAGKTTMIKLLMRFYDVNKGSIKIDGHDLRDFNRSELREMFGMVLQDTWLYNGSIMENIRYGRLDATDEEVMKAAKAARAEHFILTQPDGYQMILDEETSNISQGQKQLLTIARAILADPKILILDEATSSVDTRTEVEIQKAMDTLMEGRTSFVIAHRLSTIRDADLILVMKDGDIIEQGNHEELLARGGFYEKLYNSQFEEVEESA